MPRPRKYSSGAERAKAYRTRRKLKEQAQQPDLNELARIVHKLYKDRAAKGFHPYEHLVGKTPFETLVRSVLYHAMFEKVGEDGAIQEFEGWDKVITADALSPDYAVSYNVIPSKKGRGFFFLLPDDGDDLEPEETEKQTANK